MPALDKASFHVPQRLRTVARLGSAPRESRAAPAYSAAVGTLPRSRSTARSASMQCTCSNNIWPLIAEGGLERSSAAARAFRQDPNRLKCVW